MNDRYEIIDSRIMKNYDYFLHIRDNSQKKTFIVSYNNKIKETRVTEKEDIGKRLADVKKIDSLAQTDSDKIKLFYCMCEHDSRFLYYVPDQFKTKEICELATPKEQHAANRTPDKLVDTLKEQEKYLKQLDEEEKELLSKLEEIRNKRNIITSNIAKKGGR